MVAQKPLRTKLFESATRCMDCLSANAVTSHQAFAVEVACQGSRAGHPLIGFTATADSEKRKRDKQKIEEQYGCGEKDMKKC